MPSRFLEKSYLITRVERWGQQEEAQNDTSEKQWTSLGLGECWVGLEPGDPRPAALLSSLYPLVLAQRPAQLVLSVERRRGAPLHGT